jgi:hypothetical protein
MIFISIIFSSPPHVRGARKWQLETALIRITTDSQLLPTVDGDKKNPQTPCALGFADE